MSRCAAIVVAAGSGSRSGLSIPKQFALLGGKPVLRWSVETLRRHPNVERIVVVVSPGQKNLASQALEGIARVEFVTGGSERTESVRAGLASLSGYGAPFVLIHDAARPGLSGKMISELLSVLENGADAVAPALRVADALKRSFNPDSDRELEDVNRDGLYRVQTPQGFRLGKIAAAYMDVASPFADDLSVARNANMITTLTPGDPRLMKLTYPEDFAMAERLLVPSVPPRIGSGFDVHSFEPGNMVTLCGVDIPHTHSLRGHSDADVAWHALTDAILGAVGSGDIGDHFSPDDPRWRGEPSRTFLLHAVAEARAAGFAIGNADLTIICETPKISRHREAMRRSTCEVLNVDISKVSVKATTTEQLGFTGRREGIAVQAVAMLIDRDLQLD